mgnify:FL=1
MLDVVYEDNHLIIVNKSSSDIVQGDKTGDQPLSEKVAEFLRIKYNKPGDAFIGVVHRLDRPVSGLVVFAKTSKALARMNELFREDKVKKTYEAIVKNPPPTLQGELVHFLVRNPQKNKSFAYDKVQKNAKEAKLGYKVIGKSKSFTLLEIDLQTGRHHQIRTQLSKIGCPIKGDLKYGYPRSNPNGGISLHARRISFIHPVSKKTIDVVAPYPEGDLWQEFELL